MRAAKKYFCWILALQAIVGGFLGLMVSLMGILFPIGSGGLISISLTFSALYAFVIFSGFLYLRNPRNIFPMGIALLLQVPWITLPPGAYAFTAGFAIIAGIGGKAALTIRLGSSFLFYIGWPGRSFIGINLFALGMLVLLLISIPMPGSAKQPREPATHT